MVTEGAANETGQAGENATESLSGAANETGQAGENATESSSGAANETGQAADNATTSGNQQQSIGNVNEFVQGTIIAIYP